MSDNVYLNADRTKVVPESALGKKWQVPRRVAHEMGLLESPDKPVQERRSAFDATKVTNPDIKPQRRRTPKKG